MTISMTHWPLKSLWSRIRGSQSNNWWNKTQRSKPFLLSSTAIQVWLLQGLPPPWASGALRKKGLAANNPRWSNTIPPAVRPHSHCLIKPTIKLGYQTFHPCHESLPHHPDPPVFRDAVTKMLYISLILTSCTLCLPFQTFHSPFVETWLYHKQVSIYL